MSDRNRKKIYRGRSEAWADLWWAIKKLFHRHEWMPIDNPPLGHGNQTCLWPNCEAQRWA